MVQAAGAAHVRARDHRDEVGLRGNGQERAKVETAGLVGGHQAPHLFVRPVSATAAVPCP
jgi:hypothetical protein